MLFLTQIVFSTKVLDDLSIQLAKTAHIHYYNDSFCSNFNFLTTLMKQFNLNFPICLSFKRLVANDCLYPDWFSF